MINPIPQADTIPKHIFDLMAQAAFKQAKAMVEERKHLERLKLYGAAKQLWNCTEREAIIAGPAGTGKSLACLALMHYRAISFPGSRHLIARDTRSSLTFTGLVTFEEHILGLDHPMVTNGSSRKYRHTYTYPNGSEIIVGGMDKSARFLSSEFDTVFIQQVEEISLDDWETLITRLRHYKMPFQQIYGDANPDAPSHWIKTRCDMGEATMFESRHEDNPLLYDHGKGTWTELGRDYLAKLDALTGVRRRRLRFGEWAAAENAIYSELFDRAVHLIDPFMIPQGWKRFRAIDFGYTNPAVVQWWAVDDDGRMYLYRELYRTGLLVSDIAHKIKTSERWYRYANDTFHDRYKYPNPGREIVDVAVCDWDAEDRATLEAAGIATVAADKRVKTGIEAVQQRLKIAGDGKPRLFIFKNVNQKPDQELIDARRPFRTEHEFDQYCWHPNKEEPVKRDDHGLDALRYAAMYVDGPGSINFRSIGGSGKSKSQVLTSSSRSPRRWDIDKPALPTRKRWQVE